MAAKFEHDVYPQCLFVLLDSFEGFWSYARVEEGLCISLLRLPRPLCWFSSVMGEPNGSDGEGGKLS